jgi:ketosteroid isomerase-like protein
VWPSHRHGELLTSLLDQSHGRSPGESAAGFTLSATALFADGRHYENEYSVWVHTDGGAIVRVWEYLDVADCTR